MAVKRIIKALINTLNLRNYPIDAVFIKQAGPLLQKYAKGKLIDIGCADKPYKDIIAPYVSEHIGLDCESSLYAKDDVDLFGTASDIPVENEVFDTVLCTAVLEHLNEPDEAVKEAYRILKRGGCAIYSVPFFYHLHDEPDDYYRYTKYGLEYLFKKNGFEIIDMMEVSGFWMVFGREFSFYLHGLRKLRILSPVSWFIAAAGILVGLICRGVNKIDSSRRYPWAYLIVARK